MIEKGTGLASGIRDFFRDLNISNVSTGLIPPFLMSLGLFAVTIEVISSTGISPEQVQAWVIAIHVVGPIIGIILSLYYKNPIAGAYSIPGMFVAVGAFEFYNINQVFGAALIAGILVLILGLTGWIKRAVSYIPMPILMAMVAGVLFKWGMGIVDAFNDNHLLIVIGLLGYVFFRRVFPKIPAVLGTFIFGAVAAGFMKMYQPIGAFNFSPTTPLFCMPEFSLGAFFSVSIPLAILVIGAENMQAIAILKGLGFKPPINAMTIISGIGGVVASLFGGHNGNIAGPLTAVAASEEGGPVEKRYVSAVFCNVVLILFGTFAAVVMSLLDLLPAPLISLVIGLVMLSIISGALETAFATKKFRVGTFFSLIIAISGVSIFQIGAPFWAVVIGCIMSFFVEPGDFQVNKEVESL
ncbi:MAG: benzoate transporter [Clostridia bacterium]|nr:benzoate transporter [Clostridia bacterium]